jgi:hypothetical protein
MKPIYLLLTAVIFMIITLSLAWYDIISTDNLVFSHIAGYLAMAIAVLMQLKKDKHGHY